MRRPLWVVMTYAVLILLGIGMALPNFLPATTRDRLPAFLSENTVSLGLDLQGGAHLLLAIDRPALALAERQSLQENVADLMQARGLDPEQIVAEGDTLTLPADAGLASDVATLANDGLLPGLPASFTIAEDGDRLILRLTEAGLTRTASDAAAQSLEVIRHRVDQVGVAEPVIQRVGADRILVQLPGVDNPGQLRALLGSTAKMSFHMVDEGATTPRTGYSALPLRDGGGTIIVQDRAVLSGDRLTSAATGFDQLTNAPVVNFQFDPQGAVIFAEVTQSNIGRQFAIVLDGEVLTAPAIREAIPGGQGQISGGFTTEEAGTLAVLLNSGALPASLEVIEERSVGAALGSDSIRMGLLTGAAGLALVVVMMGVLYGGWGLVASAMLGLNIMLTLTALGLIGATLTLPGIAGIILCLGIAVDANILIFSRIREETAKGTVGIKALNLGYDRAWATIWDANITTLLAMILLFAFGAGAIRGFAVTMTLGILISMFTAIELSRLVLEWHVRRSRIKAVQIRPLIGRVMAPGNWSFMRHKTTAIIVSAVLSIGSLGLLVAPGPNLGIDFTGGVQMTVTSEDAIPLADLRQSLAALDLGAASLQEFGDAQEVLIRLQGDAGQATVTAIEGAVQSLVPDAIFDQIDLVGPLISGELATTGLIALGLAVLGMMGYIWLRFDGAYAVGAIAVLALDVTKTFGVIALMGWEVNLTTIVALLTLIGYSVNDKVVVYDRMRESIAAGGSVRDRAVLIDRSVNQVLARCLFTSGTTLAALLPMAIWGGPAVAGFAWPMCVGVVIATASSLFIAGPLLIWLAGREVRPGAEGRSDPTPAQFYRQ